MIAAKKETYRTENEWGNIGDLGDQDHARTGKMWRPELDKRHGETPWAAVLRELDRSLAAFPTDAALIEEFLKCEQHLVLVINQRLFVSPKFEHLDRSKARDHFKFVLSVMRRRKIRNAAYVVDLGARGAFDGKGFRCSERIPLFVIAKKMGYHVPGVLIPNPYFGNISRWDAMQAELRERSALSGWPDRIARALWRGTVTCSTECFGDMGTWRRWAAIVQSWKHPDVLDVKIVAEKHGAWSLRNSTSVACERHGLHDYPAMIEAYAALLASHNGSAAFRAEYLPHDRYVDYQYLLNLPGQAGGSYSRNLNALWIMGAVLVFWDAHFVEWYFPALHHGETHVAVDFGNVVDTMRRLRADVTGDWTDALRRNARDVYETFITGDRLAAYFGTVIDRLRAHFSFDTMLDDRATLNTLLRRLGCGDSFHLVEVLTPCRPPCNLLTPHTYELYAIQPSDPDLGPGCARRLPRRHHHHRHRSGSLNAEAGVTAHNLSAASSMIHDASAFRDVDKEFFRRWRFYEYGAAGPGVGGPGFADPLAGAAPRRRLDLGSRDIEGAASQCYTSASYGRTTARRRRRRRRRRR